MIKANYLASSLEDSSYPLHGVAIASGQNFKTSGTVLIGAPRRRRMLLSRIVLLTAAVATLSNGATITVNERDYGNKTAASLSTSLTGSNNDIVLTARTAGVVGNEITLTLVAPGTNNAALGIVVTGTDIVANLATDGSAAITTTATQLLAAIAASSDANALVSGALKGADTGAGVVTALAETALTGGLEYLVIQELVESTNLADTDAVGKTQSLTVIAGAAPLQPGSEIAATITAGTAGTDTKDIFIEGTVF